MSHIIKSSVRNSPQMVSVEEANRNGKAVTEGNNFKTIFLRDENMSNIVLKNEVVCFSLLKRHNRRLLLLKTWILKPSK